MAHPDTTPTIYVCGSGNSLSTAKTEKHVIPHLTKIARNRHFAVDGPGGNSFNSASLTRLRAGSTASTSSI